MNDAKVIHEKGLMIPLMGLSIAALAAQILMVRIFSFTMNHGFVYMAVSLAMLGFGISGTLLSLVPQLKQASPRSCLQFCCLGFSLSLVGSMYVFGRFASLASPASGLSLMSPLAARLLLLSLPYVFAGLGIAVALLARKEGVGLRYSVNLAGSGLGCLLAYPLLTTWGAEAGLLVLGALVCFAGVFFGRLFLRLILLAGAISFLAFIPQAVDLFAFSPDKADQLADLIRQLEKDGHDPDDVKLEYEAWDPVGRIEVHSLPGDYGRMLHKAPVRFYSQDAGAGSVLLSLGDYPDLKESLTKGTLYGFASRLRPHAEALVIGIGGGPDLIAMLAADTKKVTAVEINGATVSMIGKDQAAFLGLEKDLKSGRLALFHADGRGFVRRHGEAFDVIQMTGADTYAANPAGASILSEGYLYTTEAFRDYFHALKPGGITAVTRFGIESARVFNTAFQALKDVGVANPRDHLAVVAQGNGEIWSTVLMSKEPFSDADIAKLYALCKEGAPFAKNCWIPAYNAVGFRFDAPLHVTFEPRLPVDLESMGKKLEGDKWRLDPVYDDRPFFFQFLQRDGIGWQEVFDNQGFNKHHWDLPDYLRIALQVCGVALLLILLPLLRLGRGGASKGDMVCVGFGFVALGAGFMFLEVVLMQRCTLFLGHPNHAIVVVLFSLLLSSGLGSALSSKLPFSKKLIVLVSIVGVLVWTWYFKNNAQAWFEERLELSLWARSFQLMAWILPLGLLIGMPFPTFLSAVEEQRPQLSGWAWGANSFASVCASLIAIPVSMQLGFSFSFNLALLCYVLALLAIWAFMRPRTPQSR